MPGLCVTPRFRVTTTAIAVLFGGVGVAACGGSAKTGSSSTTTVAPSIKAAFCAGNTALDEASVKTSEAGPLTFLKANTAALDSMANNISNDPAIRADAQTLIAAGRTALATDDPSVLQQHSTIAAGVKVDAYCGVDGTDNPLPSNFGDGKATPACNSFTALYRGVRSAANPQAAVAFLKANEAKVNDLAAVGLHKAQALGAQTLVTAVRRAITTNDGSPLYTPAVITAAIHVNSFCGINT